MWTRRQIIRTGMVLAATGAAGRQSTWAAREAAPARRIVVFESDAGETTFFEQVDGLAGGKDTLRLLCDWRPGGPEHFIYLPAGRYWFGRPPFERSASNGTRIAQHPQFRPRAWRLAQLVHGRRWIGGAAPLPGIDQ